MEIRSSLPGDRLPLHPIRIYSVGSGHEVFCRMLSERGDLGLFTHWTANGSVLCDPQGCPPALHNRPRIWKGYCAADVWNRDRKLWLPCVLEITENLGVDLRGRYQRGQVWELRRIADDGKRHFPVEGRLAEVLESHQVPAEFDFVPVLLRRYHVLTGKIDLSFKNPLPDRVYVEPSHDAGPADLVGNQGQGISDLVADQTRSKALIEAGKRRLGIAPSTNGKV